MQKLIPAVFVILLFFTNCSQPKNELAQQTSDSLKKAAGWFYSISTHGGYAGIYSLDLKKRYGEGFYEPATSTEIWVQQGGTPSFGEVALRAYKITGDKTYLNIATDAARALAWGQRDVGGWEHLVDIAHFDPKAEMPVRKEGRCSFDDDMTQGPISFLIDLDKIIDKKWLTDAIETGLNFMIKSQFENGGWSQWFPLIGGYHNYFTFNDNAINSNIALMLKAHLIYGNKEYLECAKRGGDFIILSQMPEPQSGWAQQYSHDLKPAGARVFEPAGVCSSVTSRNIKTLVDLYKYTKDEKYLAPIPKAISWLEESKIAENRWARLYEVKTNRPIYGDRKQEKKILYDYSKVSDFEKTHYSWQGDAGVKQATNYYNSVKAGNKTLKASIKNRPDAKEIEPKVKEILAALDNKGRWISDSVIYSKIFIKNANTLCSYLELCSAGNE